MRTTTGVPGLDGLIEGGFPKESIILLAGTPGTGKTIFALQYALEGAKKSEKTLYVTFEEKTENLKNQAKQFGWDIEKLENEGKIKLWYIPAASISKETVHKIIEFVREANITRLIIDSISTLALNMPTLLSDHSSINEHTIQQFIYHFIDQLRALQTTTILISQTSKDNDLSRDGVSDYVCDGIVHMLYESMGGPFSRSIHIRKMRRTKNDETIYPVEIAAEGLHVQVE